MKFYLGVDGKPKNSPFHVDLSLNDFDGDKADYLDYLNELYKEWAEVARTLRPNEPNPKSYALGESDPQYQSALRIYEGVSIHEQVAYRTRPKVEPQALPLPFQILTRGNQKDKEELQERASLAKVIEDQRQKAAERKAVGDFKGAREFEDRANSFSRTLKQKEKAYSFSFVQEDTKRTLAFGKDELEKALKMKPEEIEKSKGYVENLLNGFREMSEAEESYVLDTGSPYQRFKHGGLKVIKIQHPGVASKDMPSIIGKPDNQSLLDYAWTTGKISNYDDGEAAEEKPEEAKEAAANV